jgi:hypothetical protein
MKNWLKKLRPKRTKIEENVHTVDQEKDEHKASTYTSTPPKSSFTPSHLKLYDIEEEEEDIPPTFVLPEFKSQEIKGIKADMKESSNRLTFTERARNILSRRSPKQKSRRIATTTLREKLKNLMPRRLRQKEKARDIDIEGKSVQQVVPQEEGLNMTQTFQKFALSKTFPTFPSYPEPSTHRRPGDKDMLTKLIHRSLYPQGSEDEGLGRYYRLGDEINKIERQLSSYRAEQVFVIPTDTSKSGFKVRITNVRKSRRSPRLTPIDESSVRKPVLESDVLAKAYLEKLGNF